jgi:hypothetical protein
VDNVPTNKQDQWLLKWFLLMRIRIWLRSFFEKLWAQVHQSDTGSCRIQRSDSKNFRWYPTVRIRYLFRLSDFDERRCVKLRAWLFKKILTSFYYPNNQHSSLIIFHQFNLHFIPTQFFHSWVPHRNRNFFLSIFYSKSILGVIAMSSVDPVGFQ